MNKNYCIIVAVGIISIFLALAMKTARSQDSRPMVPMAKPRYLYSGMLSNADSNRIEEFRQAGLNKDRSQVSSMVKALEAPAHIGYTYTIIHALAQMGAVEALLVIGTYSQDEPGNTQDETGGDLRNFITAARARLIAEDAVKPIPDGATATVAKIKRLYKELGMTPADFNAALDYYYHPAQDVITNQGTMHWTSPAADSSPAHPVGVYAVRQLADMMYHGAYKDCVNLPEVSQINFSGDYPSALKMRLAPLSPSERLNTMLQELSRKKILTHWDNYEIQLASNEGLVASHAAVNLLKEMEAHSDQYQDVGFMALVRVISGTGDQEQAPLVQHLLEQKLIYTGNIPLNDLTHGVKRGREPAY